MASIWQKRLNLSGADDLGCFLKDREHERKNLKATQKRQAGFAISPIGH